MQTNSLHIIIASSLESGGGCETWMSYFLPQILNHYFTVIVHCIQFKTKKVEIAGVEYSRVSAKSALAFALKCVFSINAKIKTNDTCIAVGTFEAALPILFLSLFYNIKKVAWIREKHLITKTRRRPWLRIVLKIIEWSVIKSFDKIVFNGYDTKTYYEGLYKGILKKSQVIPNAVDYYRYVKLPIPTIKQRLKICYMGRFIKEKGLPFIIAFNDLAKQTRNIEFHVFGHGDPLDESILINKGIPFESFNSENIDNILLNHDAVLFGNSSRQGSHASGVSHALLEAMAAGKLIIAADNIIHNQVINTSSGILFKEDNAYDLLYKINSINKKEIVEKQKNARKLAANYTIESHISMYLNFIST